MANRCETLKPAPVLPPSPRGRGTEGEGKAASDSANLLTHPALWRGSELARSAVPGIPTGFSQLDAELPGGGWPLGNLTELLPSHEGIGELRILGPTLANLTQSNKTSSGKHIVWVAPPYLPYAPALSAAGIDLKKVLIVKTRTPQETLWAAEQALRANACGAVLVWQPILSASGYVALRRLQIAAEGGGSLCFLFRPPEASKESSPAPLRLALSAANGGLAIHVLKRRGRPLSHPILLSALPMPPVRRPKRFESPNEQSNPFSFVDSGSSAAPRAGSVPARHAHA
jgi:hypothetical protein